MGLQKLYQENISSTSRYHHAIILPVLIQMTGVTHSYREGESFISIFLFFFSFHLEALKKIATLSNTPVNALLPDMVSKQQNTARMIQELEFRSIQFFACEQLPTESSVIVTECYGDLCLSASLPTAHKWLLRGDNWMSDTVHN